MRAAVVTDCRSHYRSFAMTWSFFYPVIASAAQQSHNGSAVTGDCRVFLAVQNFKLIFLVLFVAKYNVNDQVHHSKDIYAAAFENEPLVDLQ